MALSIRHHPRPQRFGYCVLSKSRFTRTPVRRDDKLNLQHYINKKRASFQHRYPSSNPLILQHACNVASAWQTSGVVNMLELRRELLRSGFIFDVWPQSNAYGAHRNTSQQPVHDVIVARFPHQLHDKYGDPSSTLLTKIKGSFGMSGSKSSSNHHNHHHHHHKSRKLTPDELWNRTFWYESEVDQEMMEHASEMGASAAAASSGPSPTTSEHDQSSSDRYVSSTSDAFLNYPMPGDYHHNDADSPLSVTANSATSWKWFRVLNSTVRTKIKRRTRAHRKDDSSQNSGNSSASQVDDKSMQEALVHRGYVFIFSSGCIVTWGYNGRDRDWIDEFVQFYQSKTKGWPSFAGFNLPFWVTIPLYMLDGNFLYPSDMKIPRTNFLDLNFLITKKEEINSNIKFNNKLSNDVEKWNTGDVQYWLHSVGLHKYVDVFQKHEIDGKMLLKLSKPSRHEKKNGDAHHHHSVSQSHYHQIFIDKVLLSTSSLKDYFTFTQEVQKLYINKEDIFTEDDVLCVPANTDLNTLLAISYALAQAARLQVLTIAVNYYQRNLMVITEKLAKRGTIFLRKNHWSKLVHHCEMLRDLLFDFGAQPILTQTPHFIEQRSNDLEPIYDAVLDYLDFETDLTELSSQIEQLKDRYQSDWEACRDHHGFKLEMIIILFFAIETAEFWQQLYHRVVSIFHSSQYLDAEVDSSMEDEDSRYYRQALNDAAIDNDEAGL